MAVSGESIYNFKKYNPNHSYEVGDLIQHADLGDGKVVETNNHFTVVLFKDGYIKLSKLSNN